MSTYFDKNSQIDNDSLALLKAENDRLSNANFSLEKRLKTALDTIRELREKLSAKEREERASETDLIVTLKARIKELEARVSEGFADEVAKQRVALEEEVRKEHQALSLEKDLEIASLKRDYAELEKEKEHWKSSLDGALIRITNLQAQVNVQNGALFAPSTERIQLLLNKRDPLEQAAYACLYFGGKEKMGMTDAQAALLDEHRKTNLLKGNFQKGLKMLEASAKDSDELGNLIAERERLKEEKRRRSQEERKKERIATQKERAQYGGLDLKSVNRRIKETIKRLFPGIDPSLIKFECYGPDHPLPEGVTVIRDHGAPDYTYQYVIAFSKPTVTVYVSECVRVKESGPSKAKGSDEQKVPGDGTEEVQNAPSSPQIDFSEAGFATVPCAKLPVQRALYTTPFDANGLIDILTEKYVYCSTLDSIRARFSGIMCSLPETTFSDYLHRTVDLLRWSMEDLFMERLRQEPNINVDESVQLVGVMEEVVPQTEVGTKEPDPLPPQNAGVEGVEAPPNTEPVIQTEGSPPPGQEQTGTPTAKVTLNSVMRRKYKKEYVWVFRSTQGKITFYRYDDGSRGRHVLVVVLSEAYKGNILSDCYVVYDGIGKKVLTNATHACCWVHLRRYLLNSMFVAPDEAAPLVDTIRDLFCVEATAKETMMTPEETLSYRALHSIPKVNDFFNMLELYREDPNLMAYDKFAQAVNYGLNHKTEFLAYLRDGSIQMHNSDAERAFKIIKKWMRVSLNIGSERAAMNHAFALSLFETAKQWNLNIPEYLEAIFRALNAAPRISFNYKKPEAEQMDKIEDWKKAVRPFIEPLLPWNYAKNN